MNEQRLSYSEARKFLATCEWRMTRSFLAGDDKTEVQVLHAGKWLSLGRMDDLDECRSSIDWTSETSFYKNPVAHYRKKTLLGALITEEEFFVIDSATDG